MVATGLGGFVGRASELAELDAGLADARAGRGGLYLVVGEPGIGKTRLADEFCARAGGESALIVWGRCLEGGGAPAYWPWVQVIRSCLRSGELERFEGLPERQAAYVAHIVPEERGSLGEPPAISAPESEEARFALFNAITAFLTTVAEGDRPLVVILDDLHVADTPSLLLLDFLARELRGARILLVGTYREVEARLGPASAQLGTLAREARMVPLLGLDQENVANLIRESSGRVPEPEAARALCEITAGNPFFVDEVVRLLVSEGRLDDALQYGQTGRIPDGVREVIRGRLALLSNEAGELLAVASVLGRDFDLGVLAATTDRPRAELLALLDEAVKAQLIGEGFQTLGRYSFSHMLVRETLYESLPSRRRAELHARAGAALEALHRANPEPHLAELAHHFFAAAPVGDLAKALDLSVRAARRAVELLAHEEAILHYQRSLQLLVGDPDADELVRCDLLLGLGEAQWKAGETTTARATFTKAADIARAVVAPDRLARAALGYARWLLYRVRAEEAIIELLEEALGALGDDNGGLRVRVLARLSVELFYTEQFERRLALSQEAIEIARRLGDARSLLLASYCRQWAAWGPDTLEERLANADEMVELAARSDDREMSFLGHHARLTCLLELCDSQGVGAEAAVLTRLADHLRQPFYLWRAACVRAAQATLEGRFHEAERLGQEAYRLGAERHGETARIVYRNAQLYAIRHGQGRLEELEEETRIYSQAYPWVPRWRVPLLYAELGREEEARAELERYSAGGFAEVPRGGLWILQLCCLAHACHLIGDSGAAAPLYDLLLPYAERNATSVADQSYGAVAMRLGMLAATLERWDAVEAHFEAALRLNGQLGARPFTAMTLHWYARMLLARGLPPDRPRALGLLERAAGICRSLGMESLLARVTTLRDAELSAAEADPEVNVFRREGDYWTIDYEGETVRVRDAKGLRYLALLLAHPHRELHALDVVAAAERGAAPTESTFRDRRREAAELGLGVARLTDAGERLDAQAKAAYKRRLVELEEELEEAQAFNDPERAARADEEIDAIMRELASAVGLGGRPRRAGSPAERARVNVTRSIRSAIERIAASCPSLGEHLDETIRTGTACTYAPAPDSVPSWRF